MSDGINPSVPPRRLGYVQRRTRLSLRFVMSATAFTPPHIVITVCAGSIMTPTVPKSHGLVKGQMCDFRRFLAA